jgi:hypothetical protein
VAGTREENLARATTERLTAARVAEVAGCSLANAKIRIHRARRRLKDALEAECNFYRDEENVFRSIGTRKTCFVVIENQNLECRCIELYPSTPPHRLQR